MLGQKPKMQQSKDAKMFAKSKYANVRQEKTRKSELINLQ
jgi:hypothetical protein